MVLWGRGADAEGGSEELAQVVGGDRGDGLPPGIVGRRVDWLKLAYQVELDAGLWSRLQELQLDGAETEQWPRDVELLEDEEGRQLKVSVGRARNPAVMPWKNADTHGVLDRSPTTGGWNVELNLGAVILMTHGLGASLDLGRRYAAGFGEVEAERLRRVDLCCDVVGMKLSPSDARFMRQPGPTAVAAEFLEFDERGRMIDPDKQKLYYRGLQVTGITVCPGGHTMLRLYNKTQELALPGREEKRPLEEAIWRSNGWNGEDIIRPEFQFRGEALDDYGLRNPRDLPAKLDGLWKAGTVDWTSMLEPHDARARRDRVPVREDWRRIQAVHFVHPDATPAKRSRKRGGSDAAMVLGAVRSYLASQGELAPLPRLPAGTKPKDVVARMTEAEATAFVVGRVGRMRTAVSKAGEDMLEKYGPRGAARRVWEAQLGAEARYFSADDLERGGRRR